jgi:hypothetical protein
MTKWGSMYPSKKYVMGGSRGELIRHMWCGWNERQMTGRAGLGARGQGERASVGGLVRSVW